MVPEASVYEEWKLGVVGKVLGDGQCVALVVNNPQSYVAHLFPDVSWESVFPPVPSAKDLFNDANPTYFEKILNDHNDPNQLPTIGDVMVFDATPESGYSDTYNNPDGHTGVCDTASPQGYSLLQQNAPQFGSPVNVTTYPWRFRPCIGWLRPIMPKAMEYYTVVEGDTVDAICDRFHISKADDYLAFRELNPNIPDISKIYPNEHVRVA